jgi:hypothetical protein
MSVSGTRFPACCFSSMYFIIPFREKRILRGDNTTVKGKVAHRLSLYNQSLETVSLPDTFAKSF